MLFEPEHSRPAVIASITSYAFKYPQSIMEGMGKYVDIGIVPVYEPSVHPDFFCFFHSMLLLKSGKRKEETEKSFSNSYFLISDFYFFTATGSPTCTAVLPITMPSLLTMMAGPAPFLSPVTSLLR